MVLQEALIEATRYFTRDVLGTEAELFDACPLKEAWVASITITGDAAYEVAVHVPHESLKRMAFLFLYEDAPDEAVLTDLIGEIANLIVGRAKVVAQSKGLEFEISTPRFHGSEEPIATGPDLHINFLFEEEVFSITAHEADR